MRVMAQPDDTRVDSHMEFVALYDGTVDRVYAYLLRRCSDRTLAEELTADTFVAALASYRADRPPVADVSWLFGIARHKLVDHWRRQEREQRRLRLVAGRLDDDVWDEDLDRSVAESVLAELPAHYRAVITLRYLDDQSIGTMAELLGRSVRSTESLLARARREFRDRYHAHLEVGHDR